MKKKKNIYKKLRKFLPYFAVGAVTVALVFVGSLDKHSSRDNVSLSAFADEDYRVSVDEISELYVVADLSDVLGLASASEVASNYVVANSMYESGQTSTDKLEKPNITNIVISRGVIEYTVQDGENVNDIAAKYGVTADQVRWSNGLKTTDVAAGTVLKIPSTPGIVYTVKSGDTIDSIVEKYGSNATEIIALNDLEVSGISEGMQLVIKDGNLPETERPEYVPPAPVIRRAVYAYTYLGDTSTRTNLVCSRELGAGQCTTWGWHKRPD